MPYEPVTLFERIPDHLGRMLLPPARDVQFQDFAINLPTPPLHLLTTAPAQAALPAMSMWSAHSDFLLDVFTVLTFSLSRLDLPDGVLVFLIFVWADDFAQRRLRSDPRLPCATWTALCSLIPDVFPNKPLMGPAEVFQTMNRFSYHIHQ